MNIKTGNIVMIQPTNDACQRTKNCINEYGQKGFEIVSFNPYSERFGRTPAVLLRAVSGPGSRFNKWVGWLPLMEIGESNDA